MSTLGSSLLNLTDWAKRLDPNGNTASVAELLTQKNDILLDMPFMHGNLPTGHRTTVRTGLPTPSWRLLNQGVSNTKSQTAQVDESCGILEDRSQVDKKIADLNGNTAEFRLSEAAAHIEGINQEMASTLFYGDTTIDPEEFDGLTPRYNSLSGAISQNVISAGSVTGSDAASVWLICWGEPIFGIFPKGSKAGIVHEDLGLDDAFDASNRRFRAYMDRWEWNPGLVVKDWRFAVRICNIDISALVANSSPADLINNMIKAMHRIPSLSMGKARFYMNRTVFQMLDIQRRDDVAAAGMTYADVDGKILPHFRGIPIRICDALTEAESTVS